MTQVSTPPALRQPLVKFEPEDIIVGLDHQVRVRAVLGAFGIVCSEEESSELLGLAKMKISDVDRAAQVLVSHVQQSAEAQQWREEYPRPSSTSSLDQLLWGLRGVFAARYSGWSPTIGKNRYVGQVHGVGEVNHGGGGDPEPVTTGVPLGARASAPGRGVRVGVLDTAIYAQPWLAGGWLAPYDNTVVSTPVSSYAQGHATFVTGLILSQAPGATVEVRGVLDETGQADSWSVAKAIVELGRTGLDVLNLSFTCYTEDGQPPMVLAAAIDRLDPDLVVVAAAGNHGRAQEDGPGFTEDDSRKPAWPAALDDVVAVGATTADGAVADFSPDAPWVDVLAPGVDLVSTYLPKVKRPKAKVVGFNDYARWSGTSFAAALVSGVIAAETVPDRVSSRQALRRVLSDLKTEEPALSVSSATTEVSQPRRPETLAFPAAPFLAVDPSTPWCANR